MRVIRKKPISIGIKTLISHVTLAVIVVSLASVLSYVLITQYARSVRMDDLETKAQHIAESVHTMSDGGIHPSPRVVDVYQDLSDARVFFLDASTDPMRMWQYLNKQPEPQATEQPAGDKRKPELADDSAHVTEVEVSTAANAAEEGLHWVDVIGVIDRQFAARILNGETVSAVRQFEFVQGVVLFAGVPIRDAEGKTLGGVILAQPLDRLHRLSRAMGLTLAVVFGISLLLAILLATQLTRVLVNPITRITRAARRMTDGTYAERITRLPNDEIGDLGRAMNSMSARLIDVIRNLREERDKLELVISSIREGVIAVNMRGSIVHYNETFLELAELDEIGDVTTSGDANLAAMWEMLLRCMKDGHPERMDWINASGRALHADVSALTDEGGEILGTVCLMRDASEDMRMEQLRREYVANVSHELRTPLTGIRGMVEPLIDGCMETEDERQECYRVILKETIRLEKMVGEMLDMSRLQDGRVSVELERLELPGILEAVVRSMKGIADEAGVDLKLDTDGSPLICMGNEDRIHQVLVILIDNALSFTPSGGSVQVSARDEGNRIAVCVADTGCGIEPRDLPLIWERFFKADRSRMRTTGTGLGLSIAKLVVELMGGEIGVVSEPGKGAKFTFTLKK